MKAVHVIVKAGCNCIKVGFDNYQHWIESAPVNSLDQPLFLGLSLSTESTGIEVILSFGGAETTLTVPFFGTYNTKLVVGAGVKGYVSDLKIWRVKSTTADFQSKYRTSGCPGFCPSQCRSDNTCDFMCDENFA